jgi:hypothetical protein
LKILSFLLFIIIFLNGTISIAQDNNTKTLNPTITKITIPTEKERKDYLECKKISDMLYKTNELEEEKLTENQKKLYHRSDELADINIIGGMGCSWYCGGGPYKIAASSNLKQNNNYTYHANNAHDFDAFTAWIEGKDDYGIGEYIEYFFKPLSPPVTAVKILNGYIKNDSSWRLNSRVKTFKLYINNSPYALLNLKDIKEMQTFDLKGIFQSKIKNQDLVLKFVITDVYPGEKYKDVSITEIEFDGTGVH